MYSPWEKPEWIYYEDQANDLSESKTVFQPKFPTQKYKPLAGNPVSFRI